MAQFVSLAGSQRVPRAGSTLTGPIDRSEIATLTIVVRPLNDRAVLDQWVQEQALKPLKDRLYLSKIDLASRFGAASKDLDQVEKYASAHNLVVIDRQAASRSLQIRGALGDLLNAFPANVKMYQHATGPYRGRTGEIQVPPDLSPIITAVLGFDTRKKRRSNYSTRISAAAGPGGANGQPPPFFANRYKFPQQYQGIPLDGTGQTIAILELGGGYRTGDLQQYFNEIGLPMPTVSQVSVDGVSSSPSTPDSDDGEVMLDIEVAGAIAPKANFLVYFAPNQGDAGFVDAIRSAVHDPERRIDIISISWGSPEPASTNTQELAAYHDLFVDAAALGITVCVATGDHGVADLPAAQWDGSIHVDHPAVDPMVIACGGTQIDATNKDVVWNDGLPFDVTSTDGGGWAGGGGISKCYQLPTYQQNAHLPVSIDGGQPGRGTPDIAMSATNYFNRVDSVEYAGGGTSAVAPLMAALVALLNQAKQKNIGFINPFLYANPGCFGDVTQGTNGITGTIPGYAAGPGWDACSGLGTPDGTAILNAL